jgi:hypothetical protein
MVGIIHFDVGWEGMIGFKGISSNWLVISIGNDRDRICESSLKDLDFLLSVVEVVDDFFLIPVVRFEFDLVGIDFT